MSDTERESFLTLRENRPPSPKEELVCPPKEEDSVSLSGECDTHTDQAAPEKAEKETADDIGGELDYEEEIIQFPPQDSCENKKDGPKSKKDVEEGEDEGEISGEEDDLEEGELKDGASCETSQSSSRQICRFFTRGQCYYGTACRFLHLTNSGKGQYNMFARYPDGYYGTSMNMMMCDRAGPRTGIDYMGSIPAPPLMQIEQSPVESAWERGLREAKELVKKANKRKEEEPDFDKKKNYLSINFNEKNTDFDKENDYLRSYSSKRKPEASYKKNSRDFVYDETQRRDHLRGGPPPPPGYENFEINYTHSRGDDMMQRMNFDRRTRERSRGRASSERERYASKERNRDRNKVKKRDDRALFHVQMRTRAFEYVDPWRRSKTPKARGGRSRSGSYSSVSSSYSDRSSRSASGSYSRSSSRTSCASSRSPSICHKRKSPGPDTGFSKASSNRFPPGMRKKPSTARSPSFSSRSRSISTAPSVSRSRSYSRSISMDSVSSDSAPESGVSHSSCESLRKKTGNSLLRKKSEEKLPLEKLDEYREGLARGDITESYPEEPPEEDPAPGFTSYMQFLPDNAPGNEKAKSQHKQPIKLTLLSKPSTSKTSFPKKELDRSKLLPDPKNDTSKPDNPSYSLGVKRPLSPTSSLLNLKPDPVLPKKSASSRRDELLKQLKAVEDAIARKRAKFC